MVKNKIIFIRGVVFYEKFLLPLLLIGTLLVFILCGCMPSLATDNNIDGIILKDEQPNVAYLINNAGIGEVLGRYNEGDFTQSSKTIALNCSAVVALCNVCIPYMKNDDRIINLSSQSSFQPVPYINLYAATKAFVTSCTRGLNVELKNKGVTATAVCAGWTETEMLPKTLNNLKIKYPGITLPKKVAVKALKDAKKGIDCLILSIKFNSEVAYYLFWKRLKCCKTLLMH